MPAVVAGIVVFATRHCHCEKAAGRRSKLDPRAHAFLERDCFGALRAPRNDGDYPADERVSTA